MEFYRNFAKKKLGSVMPVVLTLIVFCALILTLFLEDVFDNAKYRQQMLCLPELKVEAYSALDLAITSLGNYKQNQSVDKMGSGTVKKGDDKFIFDADILGDIPTNALISKYITEKIYLNLSKASLPAKFQIQRLSDNVIKHGNLTIQLDFEDLNAQIPLSKEFNDFSSDLVAAALDKLSASKPSIIKSSATQKIKDFINNKKTFTKWSTVEYVVSEASNAKTGTKTGENPIDIGPLKEWFIIERCISKFNKTNKGGKHFKINLLTVPQEILDTISARHGGIVMPNSRKFADFNVFIGRGGILENYCSNEIQFFALKVHVSNDQGNAYNIHCICDATGSQTRNQRLPFNIIKIEEF
ncbi:MAG: hypothetical protein LBF34_00505 [Puniceicoccales bacterium]|jgi:hypothetical protein|nr:hypothetical protein [Puniceicoccales bacterium]